MNESGIWVHAGNWTRADEYKLTIQGSAPIIMYVFITINVRHNDNIVYYIVHAPLYGALLLRIFKLSPLYWKKFVLAASLIG